MQDRRGHCVQVTPGMPWRPQDTAPRGVIEREFTSPRERRELHSTRQEWKRQLSSLPLKVELQDLNLALPVFG